MVRNQLFHNLQLDSPGLYITCSISLSLWQSILCVYIRLQEAEILNTPWNRTNKALLNCCFDYLEIDSQTFFFESWTAVVLTSYDTVTLPFLIPNSYPFTCISREPLLLKGRACRKLNKKALIFRTNSLT